MKVTESWLSAQLGIPTGEVVKAVSPAKRGKDGNFEEDAIEFAFAWLRRQQEFIPGVEIAELLDVSKPTITNMVRDGILEQDIAGRHLRAPTLKKLFSWLKERMGEGKTVAAQQKNEVRSLDIELKKAELAKVTGEWISLNPAMKAWENNVLLARGRLLRMANKLAPRMPFLTSEVEIANVIQTEVEEALAEVARGPEYLQEPGEEK